MTLGQEEDVLITHLSLVRAFGMHVDFRSLGNECGYMKKRISQERLRVVY